MPIVAVNTLRDANNQPEATEIVVVVRGEAYSVRLDRPPSAVHRDAATLQEIRTVVQRQMAREQTHELLGQDPMV